MKRLWLEYHLAKSSGGQRGASAPNPCADVSPEIMPLSHYSDDDEDEFEMPDDYEDEDNEFVYKGPAPSRGLPPSASVSDENSPEHEMESIVKIYDQSLLRKDLSIDFRNAQFSNHVNIQIESLIEDILNKISLFYVCSECGKIFWAGGHFQRLTEQFGHVISKD